MIHLRSKPGDDMPDITIVDLRFEHRQDALGIGTTQPRLSWKVATNRTGWYQAGYELVLRPS